MYNALQNWYTDYFAPAKASPDIASLPLLGYPTSVLYMFAAYLLFTLKIGPAYMKNRAAFDLKTVLLIYNSFQVCVNFFIFYYSVILQIRHHAFTLDPSKTLSKDHPQRNIELWTSYAFFAMKIVDLFDTVFFVLRKSFRQVSFLHVYHHISITIWVYIAMHFYGPGHLLFYVKMLNSFVHTVMYGYYLLTAQFPQYRVWLSKSKKYITRLQLIQFFYGMFVFAYMFVYPSDRGFDFYYFYSLIQLTVYVYLFVNFYFKSYYQKHTKPKSVEPKSLVSNCYPEFHKS